MNDYEGRPGQVIQCKRTGERKVLSRRKEGSDAKPWPGWWLTDTGGLADHVLEQDWVLLDEFVETPEQTKTRKVAAFAAHGPRYARLAEALIGADDPVFAVAHLLVDVHARLDGLVDRVQHLEFRLGEKREGL